MYKEYRIFESSDYSKYEGIIYKGFVIHLYILDDNFYFKIDNQLLRKLKLLKLNNEIKFNSIEYILINLIDNSKECECVPIGWSCYTGTHGTSGTSAPVRKFKKHNNILKYHSRKFNQKFKQYK